MSREAWGDEGLVPQHWDDTAMRQEFDVLRQRFDKWCVDYKSEGADGDDFKEAIDKANEGFDALSELMKGGF